jgi:CBS domain-containing protein
MGITSVRLASDPHDLRQFMKVLLNEVRALETMIDRGLFEQGKRRIGAEQEFFLVDRHFQPAPLAMEILDAVQDMTFTTELARFNLETNLTPVEFKDQCLSALEGQINTQLAKARQAAQAHDAMVILTGILPTIRKNHLNLNNITPLERYHALNQAILHMRGKDYELRIKGIDELSFTHESVMIEACNTSFQVHFQVTPEEFPRLYNIAQLIAGPLLACATNSPLLMGKRLWHETRIALFQQAVDTRNSQSSRREREPRVWFGSQWVKSSVLELFREDIARFRVLFGADVDEDPFAMIEAGQVPNLDALRLHTGTIYRWNRPCYGISEGKPHLRIENRILPSGPTVVDAIGNAALFFGLMKGIDRELGEFTQRIDFDDVKTNFFNAAQFSLDAQFKWLDQKQVSAKSLLTDTLIPLAESGLSAAHLHPADIQKFLGVVLERCRSGQTGSYWTLKAYQTLKSTGPRDNVLATLAEAMHDHSISEKPVHTWPLPSAKRNVSLKSSYATIETIMNTSLYTVHEDDLIDLVADVMSWQRIRHIAVENQKDELVGLISYRRILKKFSEFANTGTIQLVSVKDIMVPNPHHLHPSDPTTKAIELMRHHGVSALPVLEDNHLVGMVTELELFELAVPLLMTHLQEH